MDAHPRTIKTHVGQGFQGEDDCQFDSAFHHRKNPANQLISRVFFGLVVKGGLEPPTYGL